MARKSQKLSGIKESTTKEKVLKNVRNALISRKDNPFKDVDFSSPVLKAMENEPEVEFAIRFKEAGGEFVYCANEKAIADNLQQLLKQKKWPYYFSVDEKITALLQSANIPFESNPEKFTEQIAGITRCDFLIARFGSIVVSSGISSISTLKSITYPPPSFYFPPWTVSNYIPVLRFYFLCVFFFSHYTGGCHLLTYLGC